MKQKSRNMVFFSSIDQWGTPFNGFTGTNAGRGASRIAQIRNFCDQIYRGSWLKNWKSQKFQDPNTAWYHVMFTDVWRIFEDRFYFLAYRQVESWGSKGVGHSRAGDGQVTKIARLDRFSMHAFNLWTLCDFRTIHRRCNIWSFLVFQFPLDAEALLRQEREALEVFFGTWKDFNSIPPWSNGWQIQIGWLYQSALAQSRTDISILDVPFILRTLGIKIVYAGIIVGSHKDRHHIWTLQL